MSEHLSPIRHSDFATLRGLPGVLGVVDRPASDDANASFYVNHAFGDAAVRDKAEETLREKGWPIRHLADEGYTLEEVFIALVRAAERRAA